MMAQGLSEIRKDMKPTAFAGVVYRRLDVTYLGRVSTDMDFRNSGCGPDPAS